MVTKKDGLVGTHNSIKWSTPDVEQHGEKNLNIVYAFINEAGYILEKAL